MTEEFDQDQDRGKDEGRDFEKRNLLAIESTEIGNTALEILSKER